eukprot:TRINITY_DN77528_c0_g1_i1.p2 TRINITY_DN77528_c0_g1~~TRINITY_DN77528_c0_g1_i1.p2  ORF type:complete len:262 (-),score=100.29 TRINITY_DN77528_c0_g1_i1:15-800(-)
MSQFGGAPRCPRCSKSVYAAEQVLGAGKAWHKHCFNCKSCRTRLDSTSLRDHKEEDGSVEIYCKSCHGKAFGPAGYGFGQGAGVLSHTKVSKPADVSASASSNSSAAASSSYSSASKGVFCTQCGKGPVPSGNFCPECGAKLQSKQQPGSKPQQQQPPKPPAKPSNVSAARAMFGGGATKPMKFGGAPKCGRCQKSVYAAEKVLGAGQSWHKACFKCTTCNKRLDSSTLADSGGKLYCRPCHSKQFGPKGIGFGIASQHTK